MQFSLATLFPGTRVNSAVNSKTDTVNWKLWRILHNTADDAPERHINPRDPARDTASVRVLAASFEKMRLTCDFTVSGEISRVRAMRLFAKPWLINARTSRSRAVRVSLTWLPRCSGGRPALLASHRASRLPTNGRMARSVDAGAAARA